MLGADIPPDRRVPRRAMAEQHALVADAIKIERLLDFDRPHAGARHADVEIPVLVAVAHGLVIAAEIFPQRAPHEDAGLQLVGEQKLERVVAAREIHLDGAEGAQPGEHETDIGGRVGQSRMHFGEETRVERVVAIERQNEFAARTAETGVARRARALVALADHRDRRIERVELGARLLVRAIIDDDDLEIAERLCGERGKQPVDEAPSIVARHDDADGGRMFERHCSRSLLFSEGNGRAPCHPFCK